MSTSIRFKIATGCAPVEGPKVAWRGAVQTTRTTAEALAAQTEKTVADAALTSEKLIGENNLRPIGFLERGVMLSKAVCLVEVAGFGSGTGFLIGPGVVMTNHHVIPTIEHAGRARVRFNYEEDVDGRLKASEYVAGLPQAFYFTNQALDYSLIAVSGSPELRYGIIPIVPGLIPSIGSRVNIIQHPEAEPKQIALVDNEIAYVDQRVAQYLTDTLPGSSGSPVFDDNWSLVALHHSGGWIPSSDSSSTHFRNEGILIAAIFADLVANGLA